MGELPVPATPTLGRAAGALRGDHSHGSNRKSVCAAGGRQRMAAGAGWAQSRLVALMNAAHGRECEGTVMAPGPWKKGLD